MTDGGCKTTAPPELWGGHECTVNRVGDRWFDQTVRSGHQHRPSDLALFADLGIRRLRYPALWERIAPDHPDQRDFAWTDARLPEITRLGMAPILTLCHHGSGPRYTSLLDDAFAPGLAAHAAAVAARYPWVTEYTPVNEPLTTARFSALYGFWYPHARDEGAFWRALVNQIDATRLAMRAIRAVNSAARLIQTDDLGYCHATAPLAWEGWFQNARRWMGWDLLCGTVVPGHPLWDRLAGHGLADSLRAIADDPCPPDVIGINHYPSSERLIDHRADRYGTRAHADRALGDSAGTTLVDIDAIRHAPDRVIGLPALIEQAWNRYRIPVAITECHHGSTREEQARWFAEVWGDATALCGRGVDLCAVTAWSLLGSYDWDHMVTRNIGHYETGVFDVRTGTPRRTLMADVLQALPHGGLPHPVLAVPGWWHVDRRAAPDDAAPLLMLGDDGILTRLACQACEVRGLPFILHPDIAGRKPWALVDARDPATAPDDIAAALCARLGIGGVVFTPVGQGREATGLLVIEIAPPFSADDDAGLPVDLLDSLDAGLPLPDTGADDWSGVYAPTLIDVALDLLLDGRTGRVRCCPPDALPSADLAGALAAIARGEPVSVQRREPGQASTTVNYHPPIEIALERFVRDRRWMRSIHPVPSSRAPLERITA